MSKELIYQYPSERSKDDIVGTVFENVKFEENKVNELKQDLSLLAKDLFEDRIVKKIEYRTDTQEKLISINITIDNLEGMNKEIVYPNYLMSPEQRLAEYVYCLSTIVLYRYDHFMQVNIFKEDNTNE